jgi:hypothetical protein
MTAQFVLTRETGDGIDGLGKKIGNRNYEPHNSSKLFPLVSA